MTGWREAVTSSLHLHVCVHCFGTSCHHIFYYQNKMNTNKKTASNYKVDATIQGKRVLIDFTPVIELLDKTDINFLKESDIPLRNAIDLVQIATTHDNIKDARESLTTLMQINNSLAMIEIEEMEVANV